MAIDTTTALLISCDNPSCPNTQQPRSGLVFDDLAGWLLVTSEVYGQSSQSHVFCGYSCAALAADALVQAES